MSGQANKYSVGRGVVCPGLSTIRCDLPSGKRLFFVAGERLEVELEDSEVACLRAVGYDVDWRKPKPPDLLIEPATEAAELIEPSESSPEEG